MQIGNHTLGEGQPTFIIAEVGINHNGDLAKAKQLIDAAAEAGADAVKLQTYITEKRTEAGSPIFDILKQCELSFEDKQTLFDYARSKDILVFSTPFDLDSVAFLKELNAPCMKIASFDLVNHELLNAAASTKVPIILSRGMASQAEIDAAVELLKSKSAEFALLHCISAYPVPEDSDLNLRTVAALGERYGCPVGYSDHTKSTDVPGIAVAAGASIIEKHFMLEADSDAPDAPVSLQPSEFSEMVARIRSIETMLGSPQWESIDAEKDIRQFRRVRPS